MLLGRTIIKTGTLMKIKWHRYDAGEYHDARWNAQWKIKRVRRNRRAMEDGRGSQWWIVRDAARKVIGMRSTLKEAKRFAEQMIGVSQIASNRQAQHRKPIAPSPKKPSSRKPADKSPKKIYRSLE